MRKWMISLLLLAVSFAGANAQKWAEKSRMAVFSVMAYDASGNLLRSGNGFFTAKDGTAFAEFSIFKGASSATVVDAQGRQMKVVEIVGANDIYDFAKLRVDVSALKDVEVLEIAAQPSLKGQTLQLLPYSTQKKPQLQEYHIKDSQTVNGSYEYYTLLESTAEKMASCPLMNLDGQVVAMVQASGSDGLSYAVDARFIDALVADPMSFSSSTMNATSIAKAFPEDLDQATATLYMSSTTMGPEAYSNLLDRFIQKFPDSSEGYLRRALNTIAGSVASDSMDKVQKDLDYAEKLDAGNSNVYFMKANMMYSYLLSVSESEAYKGWTLDAALENINKAISMDDLPSYQQLKGDLEFGKGNYSSAGEAYIKAATSTRSSSTYYYAARCLELQDDLAGAMSLMDSVMTCQSYPLTSEGAAYLYEHARICMLTENYRQAYLDYSLYETLSSVTKNASLYYDRSIAALQTRAYQAALEDMETAVAMEPDNMDFRGQLAVVNMRVGRNQEAINGLDKAIAINSGRSDLYRLKGLAYIQLKQNKKAKEFLETAVKMGDDQAQALIDKYCK